MAVALVHRRIGGEAIEITVALRIPHPDAFAARQNDTERLVVLGAKARFRRDEISDRWPHLFAPKRAGTRGSPVADRGEERGCYSSTGRM